MKSSPIHIVCTIDNNYAQHCGVMLYSLFENNPHQQFDIFILTEGISSKNKKKLQRIIKAFNQNLNIISIDFSKMQNYPVSDHVSLATYYRLTMPDYIPDTIDKVLFLDADIIIEGDISDLWTMDIDDYSHAAAEDPGHDEDRKNALDMPPHSTVFNAGVMLINLKKWRKENIAKQVIEYINNNQSKIKWWDQDALNAVLYDDYILISNKWNLLYNFFLYDEQRLGISNQKREELVDSAAIIHFNTSSKPWHKEDTHPRKNRYIYYLRKTPWKIYNYEWDSFKRYSKRLRDRLSKKINIFDSKK